MMLGRRALFLAVVGFGIFSACSDERDYSESRLIDKVCAQNACIVAGNARQRAGLSADSIGFELGPGPSSVVFPLTPDVLPASFGSSFTVEVLIKGEGTTSLSRLIPNYEWQVADMGDSKGPTPESAKVEISDGSRATIVDLRLVRPTQDYLCSVRAPGLRRHAPKHRASPKARQ